MAHLKTALLGALAFSMSACTAFNTFVHDDINQPLYNHAVRPTVRLYQSAVPEDVREAIDHFSDNLDEPITAANDVLQANFTNAGESTIRFVVNTTAGIAGTSDRASEWFGLTGHESDLGQTFGRWGVPAGPCVMVPLLGPTNPRDGAGRLAGFYVSPMHYVHFAGHHAFSLTTGGVAALNQASDKMPVVDSIERSSIDPAASTCNLYQQHRAEMVRRARGENNLLDTPDDVPEH